MERLISFLKFIFSSLADLVEPIYQSALSNPLATGAILLALLIIPLIVMKVIAKKDERLEQFEEDMEAFEGDTPLIDLQKNFQKSAFNDPEPSPGQSFSQTVSERGAQEFDYGNDAAIPELEPMSEEMESDHLVDLSNLVANEETRENAAYAFSEDTDRDDSAFSEDSIAELSGMDDWNADDEPLPIEDTDWSRISQPTSSSFEESDFENDSELTIEGVDGLQDKIDESYQNGSIDFSPKVNGDESVHDTSMDSDFPAMPSENSGFENTDFDNGAGILFQDDELPENGAPASGESEYASGGSSEEDDTGAEKQQAFDHTFENPAPATVSSQDAKTNEKTDLSQNLFMKPVRKMDQAPIPTRNKYSGEDYQDLLESLILLRGQKS